MSTGSFSHKQSLRCFGLLCLSATLFGCGAGTTSQSGTVSLALHGKVHGGQQAVSGSTVQLYTVGTTGNASAASPLIPSGEYYLGGSGGCVPSSTQTCYTSVISDSNGDFTLTGDYTCPSSSAQVYIVATGGNPGLAAGTHNSALVLMDALGSCGNLSSASFVFLNEVTTVAAAWALAPFMTSYSNVGASATNTTGIANAFLDAQLLANTSTGNAATLPSNLTIETNKLYALANVIAPCINSDGTTGCATLFSAATPSGGTAPKDVLSAALNIVKNPGYNVKTVFQAITPEAPFGSSLTKTPNDWTMSLTITGGGLSSPTALGIDTYGNVWAGDYIGLVSGFSPQGTPFSAGGYGSGSLNEVYGLAVGPNNNIWAVNEEDPAHGANYGSVTVLNGYGSGSTLGGVASITSDSTIDFPLAIALDSNTNNMYIANYANGSATIYSSSNNQFLAGGYGQGNSAFPVAVAPDALDGVWLANQSDSTVTHADSSGHLIAHPNCCDGADGIATDSAGNAWVASYYGSSVSEVAYGGNVLIQNEVVGGLNHPAGIAVDAAQNIWTVNYRGNSFTELAGINNTLAPGTAISPGPTSFNAGGYGLDASLLLPFAIEPDASGNLWVSNFADNNLVMFFGLATPTATPSRSVPVAP